MSKFKSLFVSLGIIAFIIVGGKSDSIRETVKELGKLPQSFSIRTGRSHDHFHIQANDGIKISKETAGEGNWILKKKFLLEEALEDQVALDELYHQTQKWIEDDSADFERAFHAEILDSRDIDIAAAFFLMNAAIRYSKNVDGLINSVLRASEKNSTSYSHHVGGSVSDKIELLKVHALTELRNKDDVSISEDLKKNIVDLVQKSLNLAVVREGMVVLSRHEGMSPGELSSLVSKRSASERFAYSDLL